MKRSPCFRALSPLTSQIRRFARREDGSFVVFTLFIILSMLIAVGIGVDTMRYEIERTKVQNTADRAVLAAADLEQRLDAQAVVHDYFKRMGLDSDSVNVTVTPSGLGRVVEASSTVRVPSLFLDMIGVRSLSGPAASAATETVTDVEVALVLDNSGSMNSNNRLNLLKGAAKKFVDDVVRNDTGVGTVAISIVPFATQVAAGPYLTEYFNVSDAHAYSTCVDFGASDFGSAAMSRTAPLQRTAHFDPWYEVSPLVRAGLVCPQDASREILQWSDDKTVLKNKIDSMWAGGNTSIDVGTKWGLTLLDPSTRALATQMVADGTAPASVQGMPFAYDRPSTAKYLVVMSDGQNTTQYQIRPQYTTGPSPLWKDPGSGELSYRVPGTNTYFRFANQTWLANPVGGAAAVNLSWPEVFASYSVKYYCNQLNRLATGVRWNTCYNQIVTGVPASEKNGRAQAICAAARDRGIIVFAIGMDTYGQGDATLSDCASGESYFFDVDAREIGDAFSAIARQINQLRLTQ